MPESETRAGMATRSHGKATPMELLLPEPDADQNHPTG